jgi:hypothetical protein
MRIEYETTLDEIADTHLRVAERSKLARRRRWLDTLWVAVLTAAFLVLWLSLRGATLTEICIYAGLGALLGSGAYWLNFRRGMKRRVLKHLQEQMQGDDPLHFAVELRDDCIWAQQGTTKLLFEWSNVVEITDSPEGIEIYMRDGGFVFVRSRGFPDQEAREQFKTLAGQHVERQRDEE